MKVNFRHCEEPRTRRRGNPRLDCFVISFLAMTESGLIVRLAENPAGPGIDVDPDDLAAIEELHADVGTTHLGAEVIRAAHARLLRLLHPDRGGSAWLAAKIEQARTALLGEVPERRTLP